MLRRGFITGVNYWASNSGIKMWSDFSLEAIDKDFEKISNLKIDLIRLFPLWSDFQPVHQLRCCFSESYSRSMPDDELFADTPAGRVGIDETMLDRFHSVLRLAEKHGLKVAVGLVTGWMSGRMFVPPALEGRNLTTDPLALRMETEFIRVFVERFRDDPVIVGWTSGNETECLSNASWEEKNVWASNMRNAIKAADPTRPVLDDMHPIRRNSADVLCDRRDIFDVATVHPYVYFTPFCMNEPIDSMRGLLHAVAEAKVYEGVLQIPCFIEEIGTLGDFLCSRELSAGYAKVNLYSSWANGMTGMAWWCANEQVNLKYPPYTKDPLERELGLFDENGKEKPVAIEFREFKEVIEALPFEITKPQTDAVCILGNNTDDWANILGSYILSKQAGFNISFAHSSSIPECGMYILPSVSSMPEGRIFDRLLERVENGAKLVITYNKGLLFSKFKELTGNKLIRNSIRNGKAVTDWGSYNATTRLDLEAVDSQVLMRENDGNPFMTVFDYGKGKVIFCTAPVEKLYAETVGEPEESLLNVYKKIAEYIDLPITRNDKHIGITTHTLENGTQIAVAVNYSGNEIKDTLTFKDMTVGEVFIGNIENDIITLPPFSAALFEMK